MTVPPTGQQAAPNGQRSPNSQTCRFCRKVTVRVFRDQRGRNHVFEADPIADERTEAFCTDPPYDVFVLYTQFTVDRTAPEGARRVRTAGWVRAARDSAPSVVRSARYLLREHVCVEWLNIRVQRRQAALERRLMAGMSTIGDNLAQVLGLDSLDDLDDRAESAGHTRPD